MSKINRGAFIAGFDTNDRSLQIYLKEIRKFPLLTPEEEREVTSKMAKGDKKARDKLVQSNLRFVVNIAKEYQGRGLSLSELINEGNFGLIKAAEKFDPTKNVKFISYAVWWIRQSIMKAVLENTGNIRVPLSQMNKLNRITRAQDELLEEKGEMPTIKELADKLSLSEDEIKNAIQLNKVEISLHTPLADDDNLYLSDTIMQEKFLAPEEVFLRKRYKEVLKDQLDKLDERESYILKKYFGLDDNRPHTLEEIGEEMGISRERVRQIKERSVKKLKEFSTGTLEVYNEE